MNTKIAGILNITKDSFSDGGEYIDADIAIEKALQLINDGADIIDIGAESTHPDSERISSEVEIERIEPVVKALKSKGVKISIDTYKPEVMEKALELNVDLINDVTALSDPLSVEVLSGADVDIIMMFSKNFSPQADKREWISDDYMGEITHFFDDKLENLVQKGFDENRFILDPGMGFFLGSNAEPSLSVLKRVKRLKTLGKRIMISTSRKSFIGTVLNRPVSDRDYGTLTTEIYASLQGVDFIRTHNAKALSDAIKMIQAIES